jgi:hypothetical protein
VSQPTTTPDTEMTNPAMESNQYEDVAGRLIAQQDRQIVVVQEIEQPAIGAGATVAQPGNFARCRVDEQGFFVRVRSNALGREP